MEQLLMHKPFQLTFHHFALLLDEIETSHFTGKVNCVSGSSACELYFAQGQLIQATNGSLTGQPVLYQLLTWHNGTLTIEAQAQASISNLNPEQVILFYKHVKNLQTRGIFKAVPEVTSAATPQTITANPIGKPSALRHMPAKPVAVSPTAAQEAISPRTAIAIGPLARLSWPVEWGDQIGVVAKPKETKSGQKTVTLPDWANDLPSIPAELALPVSIEVAAKAINPAFVSAPTSAAPQATNISEQTLATPDPEPAQGGVVFENLFSYCLPPGRPTRPLLDLEKFNLVDLVWEVAAQTPNAYVLISSQDGHFGLLLLEQGKLTAVRYAQVNTEQLKGQAAFDRLQAVVGEKAGRNQVNIYQAEPKLLACYRTLLGRQLVMSNTFVNTIDLQALVSEQVSQSATVVFRFYSKQSLIFYLIHQGEVLGGYWLKGNTLEKAASISPMLREASLQLDLLRLDNPENITPHVRQKLLPSQVSILTEATNCILQMLAMLTGSERVLNTSMAIIERAASLFPCLQGLGVSLRDEKLSVNWTLDQTQVFVTRQEAQKAFSFVLAALMSQHESLLGPAQMLELSRRALSLQGIDLKKEQLSLSCL